MSDPNLIPANLRSALLQWVNSEVPFAIVEEAYREAVTAEREALKCAIMQAIDARGRQ